MALEDDTLPRRVTPVWDYESWPPGVERCASYPLVLRIITRLAQSLMIDRSTFKHESHSLRRLSRMKMDEKTSSRYQIAARVDCVRYRKLCQN